MTATLATRTREVPLWTLAAPIAVVLAAVGVGVGIVMSDSSPRQPWVANATAAIGDRAPDFASWDLAGKPVRLSDYRGTPVVLSFWATFCTACREEFPALQTIADGYGPHGLTVLAVDFRETNTTAMSRFLSSLKVDFRGVLDPQGTISAAYGVDIGLPVNVWLNREQTVVRVMVGEQRSSDLVAAAAVAAG